MQLRSGKNLKSDGVWLPICIQHKIFELIDFEIFKKGDKALCKHLIQHNMLSDPQGALCWAVSSRDHWLAAELIKVGIKPVDYVKKLARERNFLDECADPVWSMPDEWLAKFYLTNGDIEKGLNHIRPGMQISSDVVDKVVFSGNRTKNPHLIQFMHLFPERATLCIDIACMYDNGDLIKDVVNNMIPLDTNRAMRLEWAIEKGNVEVLKVLLKCGYRLHILNWNHIGLEMYTNPNALDVMHLIWADSHIPKEHVEQGLIACVEAAKYDVIQLLLKQCPSSACCNELTLAAISAGDLGMYRVLQKYK